MNRRIRLHPAIGALGQDHPANDQTVCSSPPIAGAAAPHVAAEFSTPDNPGHGLPAGFQQRDQDRQAQD